MWVCAVVRSEAHQLGESLSEGMSLLMDASLLKSPLSRSRCRARTAAQTSCSKTADGRAPPTAAKQRMAGLRPLQRTGLMFGRSGWQHQVGG